MDFSDLRRDFGKYTFNPENAPEQPDLLFTEWLSKAKEAKIDEFNAMVLSTVNQKGFPSSRIVLLKDFKKGLPLFFTNYESKKGTELKENPNASLLFFWKELERQVRIEGEVKKISYDKSNAYFKSRPTESQWSAIASPQSRVINHLSEISNSIQKLQNSQHTHECPLYWGGYQLIPTYFEFWQGGIHRLHHRLCYTLEHKKWVKEQLAP